MWALPSTTHCCSRTILQCHTYFPHLSCICHYWVSTALYKLFDYDIYWRIDCLIFVTKNYICLCNKMCLGKWRNKVLMWVSPIILWYLAVIINPQFMDRFKVWHDNWRQDLPKNEKNEKTFFFFQRKGDASVRRWRDGRPRRLRPRPLRRPRIRCKCTPRM